MRQIGFLILSPSYCLYYETLFCTRWVYFTVSFLSPEWGWVRYFPVHSSKMKVWEVRYRGWVARVVTPRSNSVLGPESSDDSSLLGLGDSPESPLVYPMCLKTEWTVIVLRSDGEVTLPQFPPKYLSVLKVVGIVITLVGSPQPSPTHPLLFFLEYKWRRFLQTYSLFISPSLLLVCGESPVVSGSPLGREG